MCISQHFGDKVKAHLITLSSRMHDQVTILADYFLGGELGTKTRTSLTAVLPELSVQVTLTV